MYIRKMLAEDIDAVYSIELQQSFPWTYDLLTQCLSKGYENFVLVDHETVIGFAILKYALDEMELFNIVVDTANQGHGLGKQLLQYIIQYAQKSAIKKIFLEVRVSNERAISLYEKVGFQQIGLRIFYYPAETGREDAMVMSLEF